MSKLLATALSVVLLAATTGAFVVTEGAKTEMIAIYGTKVAHVFSPICDPRYCETRSAAIEFKLRKREFLKVWIDRDGSPVSTLVAGHTYRKGPVRLAFTGRTSTKDTVLPDGIYFAVVDLTQEHRTITLPNPIRLDTRAPRIVPPEHLLRGHISPDGDHHHDTIRIPYEFTTPAHVVLLVNGRQAMFTRWQKRHGFVRWNGTAGGVLQPPGRYTLEIAAQDESGNRSRPVRVASVWIRYLSLSRTQITVRSRTRFRLAVHTDAAHVRWQLDGRHGTSSAHVLVLRAPTKPGLYRLHLEAALRSAIATIRVVRRR